MHREKHAKGRILDPEFDPSTGHLFFVDGVSAEVYELDPVNRVFGDGDDKVSHFDVGQYGATDTEGLGSDPARNTLLVGDRPSRKIYEVTKDGALVRIIDASCIPGMKRISGLGMAPASNDPSKMNYWIVDRAVDNGSNANENDGKLFEISVPASGNAPPAVDAGPDLTIALPDTATLQGSVVVTSRTFNQTSAGTYGQFIPGFPVSRAIGASQQPRLIQLTHNRATGSGYRTNVGFVNAGSSTISVAVASTPQGAVSWALSRSRSSRTCSARWDGSSSRSPAPTSATAPH